MASLIKNQLLKHLTKFAKNLTPDKISIDVLKGAGKLERVELNEEVLCAVLELPAFIHIKRATAIRIGVNVPWTRLKSQPIQLFIDEIIMEVEMSSELRKPKPQNMAASALSAYSENSYGFVNKVAEGISLYINTLDISFTSQTFCGSFMLSRLSAESVTPHWGKPTDLRQTRITDHTLNQTLIFKLVRWEVLRMEASASEGRSAEGKGPPISAPLRLITSQGRTRIVMKKRTTDGTMLCGRMQVILEQILWVATLPQIKSAIYFYKYILTLINKAAETSKLQQANKILQMKKEEEKLVKAGDGKAGGGSGRSTPRQEKSRVFAHFDVPQTSFHFYLAQMDLHLCDDANSTPLNLPKDWEIENGAVQISLVKLAADVYPFHFANDDRSSWVRYKKSDCHDWVQKLLDHYHNLLAVKLSESVILSGLPFVTDALVPTE